MNHWRAQQQPIEWEPHVLASAHLSQRFVSRLPPHSLFLSLSASSDFSDVAMLPPACWHYNTCSNGPSNQCHSLMPWPNRATIAKAANRVDPKTMVLNSKHLYPSKWCKCSLLSDRPFSEFSRPLSGILHIIFLKCVTLN